MIQKQKTISDKKGFALITVLVITFLLLLIASIFVMMAVIEARIARNQTIDTKTFFVAEAGYNHAVQTIKNYPTLIPSGVSVDGVIDGISYEATITLISDPYDLNRLYEIVTIAIDPITGVRKKITIIIRIQTFARYAYFTTQEISSTGSSVWFVGLAQLKDIIGRQSWVSPDATSKATMHTNGRFAFFGDPEFWCDVESVDQYVLFYPNKVLDADTYPPNHIPIYKKSFTRSVPEIAYPSNISSVDNAPPSVVITAPGGSTIVLNGSQAIINGTPHDITNIRVIKVLGNVDVSGVLDGQLTIASEGYIYVVDNLIYTHESPSSDDILGLYAQNDIVVKNDEDITPGVGKDITIDASIMALGEFTIYPFEGSDHAGNPIGRKPSTILHVNGGIIQLTRGIMGHFNPVANKVEDGYVKDFRYDNRLVNNPPPYFPTTGTPEILSWKEELF